MKRQLTAEERAEFRAECDRRRAAGCAVTVPEQLREVAEKRAGIYD